MAEQYRLSTGHDDEKAGELKGYYKTLRAARIAASKTSKMNEYLWCRIDHQSDPGAEWTRVEEKAAEKKMVSVGQRGKPSIMEELLQDPDVVRDIEKEIAAISRGKAKPAVPSNDAGLWGAVKRLFRR